MHYGLLIGSLLAVGLSPLGQAQCVVKQDTNQLVTTTCVTTTNRARAYVTITRIYKGSPYLTFPIWQQGTMQLEAGSTLITCPIEFNLVNNQVFCEVQAGKLLSVVPYQFTVQNRTFINYSTKVLGRQLPAYYELLHAGKINLLAQRKRVLHYAIKTMDVYQTQPRQYGGPNGEYNGSYEDTVQYYLQEANGELKAVELTSQSLLKALPASATLLKSRLSAQPLTIDKVVDALTFTSQIQQAVKLLVFQLPSNAIINFTPMRTLSRLLVCLLIISWLSQTLSWAQSLSWAQFSTRASPYNGGIRYTLAHGRDIRQDSTGQVYTLFDLGNKNQQIMKGTPYWTYPTWQLGSVQIKAGMAETPCQIAYNVSANEILCRFNEDTTTYQLEPFAFKIWDAKFVRLSQRGYPLYYQILYQGDAQLFSSYKRQMKLLLPQPYGSAYLIGYFLGLERYYYIKLPNGLLHNFQLTRKSLMQAMGDNVNQSLLPPGEKLTVEDVMRVLADYDAH